MWGRRAWAPAIAIGLVALTTSGWLLEQSRPVGQGTLARATLFDAVHRFVAERYVDALDPGTLYDMAIDGMLERIGDPYAAFLRPRDRDEATLTNNYGGIGLRVLAEEAGITVLEVIPGGPSERVGLLKGDVIAEVDGEPAAGWSQRRAVDRLRGPRGTTVELRVQRAGEPEPMLLEVERADVHLEAVTAFMLDERVGYARLDVFSRSSRQELQEAIDALLAAGARGVVLDLRHNPGGLLREGVEISDLFLPRGTEVVDTRARSPRDSQTFGAPGDDRYPELPLAVLVDGVTASASEIVAGALQDHDRALLIGTPTFGKGVMQSVFPLPGGYYLRLTTGKWFTPSGRSIHKARAAAAPSGVLFGTGKAGPVSALDAPGARIVGSPPDTTVREAYRTTSGRTVYGGGGIMPDLLVPADTLAVEEAALRDYLARSGLPFADLAFRFAVARQRERPLTDPDAELEPDVREAFLFYLQRRSPGVARAPLEAAGALLDHYLAVQLVTAAFGEAAGVRRNLRWDAPVARAVDLLHNADTPAGLLAAADAQRDSASQAEPAVQVSAAAGGGSE